MFSFSEWCNGSTLGVVVGISGGWWVGGGLRGGSSGAWRNRRLETTGRRRAGAVLITRKACHYRLHQPPSSTGAPGIMPPVRSLKMKTFLNHTGCLRGHLFPKNAKTKGGGERETLEERRGVLC